MKKILEYIKLPFEILLFLIFDTKYGIFISTILMIFSICIIMRYCISYEPGRYCKYCGECDERRSLIHYYPCKNSSSGKHNIEFYWKKPANGHTLADEYSKYIE